MNTSVHDQLASCAVKEIF